MNVSIPLPDHSQFSGLEKFVVGGDKQEITIFLSCLSDVRGF
jgi:hypothetical protein